MTELERAVIVAETWAQRIVMEPVLNEARLDDFHAKKALFHCVSEVVLNRAAPCITKARARVIERLKLRPRGNLNAGWLNG